MLDLSYRELQALTGGSRVGSHVLSGELGDLVPSAHRGGDFVQGVHGLLVLPHVRLPHLVLLAERLAGRVSVKNLLRFGWFLVTLAYGGVKLVQIVRDLGFTRGLLFGNQAVFEFLRKKSSLRFFSGCCQMLTCRSILTSRSLCELRSCWFSDSRFSSWYFTD